MDLSIFRDFDRCLLDAPFCTKKLRRVNAGAPFRRAKTRALMLEPVELNSYWCWPIPPIPVLFSGLLLRHMQTHDIQCSLSIHEPEMDSSDSSSDIEDYASLVVSLESMLIRVRYDKWYIIDMKIKRPLIFTWNDASCKEGLVSLMLLINKHEYS